MPSKNYGRSARLLLLVIVFQLGVGLVVLGDVANAVRGYSEAVPGIAQLLGGLLAAAALLYLIGAWLTGGGVSREDGGPDG